MLNDLVSRIDALSDVSEIGVIVVRLDFLNRMLVNFDVRQDIIDTIGTLHSTAAAMESSAYERKRPEERKQKKRKQKIMKKKYKLFFFYEHVYCF